MCMYRNLAMVSEGGADAGTSRSSIIFWELQLANDDPKCTKFVRPPSVHAKTLARRDTYTDDAFDVRTRKWCLEDLLQLANDDSRCTKFVHYTTLSRS